MYFYDKSNAIDFPRCIHHDRRKVFETDQIRFTVLSTFTTTMGNHNESWGRYVLTVTTCYRHTHTS